MRFNVKLNHEYTKDEIEKIFNTRFGSRIKGITLRKDDDGNPYILIFSRAEGPYTDKFEGDIFYYDGEGLNKNQELTPANKALIEANDNRRPILGFYQEKSKSKWTYLGLLNVLNYDYVEKSGFKVYEFKMEIEGIENYDDITEEKKIIEEITLSQSPVLTEDKKSSTTNYSRMVRSQTFRENIKSIYDFTCAICGKRRFTEAKFPEVESAHIFPKEKNGSDDIRNGLCLCKLHHWAFDGGLFSLKDDLTVLVKDRIKGDKNYEEIAKYDGKLIIKPKESELKPHRLFIKEHRKIHGFS